MCNCGLTKNVVYGYCCRFKALCCLLKRVWG